MSFQRTQLGLELIWWSWLKLIDRRMGISLPTISPFLVTWNTFATINVLTFFLFNNRMDLVAIDWRYWRTQDTATKKWRVGMKVIWTNFVQCDGLLVAVSFNLFDFYSSLEGIGNWRTVLLSRRGMLLKTRKIFINSRGKFLSCPSSSYLPIAFAHR
jgi:hypothetical protein